MSSDIYLILELTRNQERQKVRLLALMAEEVTSVTFESLVFSGGGTVSWFTDGSLYQEVASGGQEELSYEMGLEELWRSSQKA